MAFERFHGAAEMNRLGYFFGDSAIATIAVETTSSTIAPFFTSNVVAPLAEFKRVHGLALSDDISLLDAEKRTFVGVAADGTRGVTAALTNDAAYVRAYASQENLRRLVHTIQQRAVVAGVSDSVVRSIVVGDNLFNPTTGNVDGAGVAIANAQVISFLVERATVFNKDGISTYGQPTGTITEGLNLQEALEGVALLSVTATEVTLDSASAMFGVKMVGISGSANTWKPTI